MTREEARELARLREREKALRIKQQLEEIWSGQRLSSAFLKALWTTTRDGDVYSRESKEKISEYTPE